MTDTKYCYPGTDVLINHADLRQQQRLYAYETVVVTRRLAELQLKPVTGRFDLPHWQAIHRHIFQDIYPFAGKTRDVYMTKADVLYGSPRFIAEAADECFRQLREEQHLVGLERAAFIDRTAHYMTELYGIHPFREGNSRSLRELTRTLGLQAGYDIRWPQLAPELWFGAMRGALNGNDDHLRHLLNAAVAGSPIES